MKNENNKEKNGFWRFSPILHNKNRIYGVNILEYLVFLIFSLRFGLH